MTNLEIITDELSTLKFRLNPVHVSIANSLRRILLSEISTVIVKSYPHDENQCNITINNTLNSETENEDVEIFLISK